VQDEAADVFDGVLDHRPDRALALLTRAKRLSVLRLAVQREEEAADVRMGVLGASLTVGAPSLVLAPEGRACLTGVDFAAMLSSVILPCLDVPPSRWAPDRCVVGQRPSNGHLS
jgi:hypothetical protein